MAGRLPHSSATRRSPSLSLSATPLFEPAACLTVRRVSSVALRSTAHQRVDLCDYLNYNVNIVLETTIEVETAVKTRRTGVREAKARLSKLLRDVQRGHEWVRSERGSPIAK